MRIIFHLLTRSYAGSVEVPQTAGLKLTMLNLAC
jgi:hypothetical protein